MAWHQAILNHHVDVSQPVALHQEGQLALYISPAGTKLNNDVIITLHI